MAGEKKICADVSFVENNYSPANRRSKLERLRSENRVAAVAHLERTAKMEPRRCNELIDAELHDLILLYADGATVALIEDIFRLVHHKGMMGYRALQLAISNPERLDAARNIVEKWKRQNAINRIEKAVLVSKTKKIDKSSETQVLIEADAMLSALEPDARKRILSYLASKWALTA